MTRGLVGAWSPDAARARALLAELGGRAATGGVPGLGFAVRAPSTASRGDHALAADARLDDPGALADTLGAASADGALLLLEAFSRWGADFVERVHGDFAIVALDRGRGELCLARDPFGVVSLYYASIRDAVVFATDIRSLVGLAEIDLAADERSIVDTIGGFPPDEEATAFAAIRRVPPGSYVNLRPGRARTTRWYRLERVAERRGLADSECAEAVREALDCAVKSRITAGRSVGVLLSGGLDSSAVTCLAARHTSVHTFSAVFAPEAGCDEREFQDAVVRSTGAEHAGIDVEKGDASLGAREAIRVFGQPGLVGGHWLAWPLLDAASKRGVSVVLTGIDGDRVVSHGLGRGADLASRLDLHGLRAEVRASGAGALRAARVVAGQLGRVLLPSAPVRALDRIRAARALVRSPPVRVLRPDVVARWGGIERASAQAVRATSTRGAHLDALCRFDRASDVELFHSLGEAVGIDIRHPFYDRRLVELCFSLPGDQKVRGGTTRHVLREAMTGVLPELVRRRRSKAAFDVAFERWAQKALALLRRENAVDLQNLEPYAAVAPVHAALAGASSLPLDLLWKCVVVSIWLDERRNVRKGSGPTAPNESGFTRNEAARGTADASGDDSSE